MDWQIVLALAAIIFGSTGFWQWLSKRSERRSASGRLLMGIAYDKIIWQCNKYIEQGYIPADEYNELNRYLFEPYKAMGGNGTAEKLMDEVKTLPSIKEE